jgi:putative SOS response-associated peptidase YedK
MVFAGIWASRLDPTTQEWKRTCSIITQAAEGAVADIHDRMPVSLVPEVWDAWLDRDLRDSDAAAEHLRGIDADTIMEHVVSRKVNSVKNNGSDLRDLVAPETLF